MSKLWRNIYLIFFTICVMQANVSTANAMLSEAASLAISTAGGMLQEDDKKLEQEIIKDLSDDEQKQKLKKHIEETRPIIKDKSKFFNDVISPAFVWFMQKSPSFGNMIMGTVTSAYIMHYKSSLEDDADSDMLRKFEELREHNIDAGQGIFETLMDAMEPKYDNDTSGAVLITDGALLAAKGKQNYDRYTSSAAAIANVLEAAGIAMQPEDVGDICSNHIKENKQNKGNKNNNADTSQPSGASNQTEPAANPPASVAVPSNENAASPAPDLSHWIKDSRTGVYLWNPEPAEGESIVWSGGFVTDRNIRYAEGSGVVTWYRNGEVIQIDEGGFSHGRHHGHFSHKFPSGRIIYSNWDHGREIE